MPFRSAHDLLRFSLLTGSLRPRPVAAMKEIYALYSGKGSPEDVLKAASAGTPSPARLKDHLFYAHLYLGLYYEAQGDEKQARANILKAASEATLGNYMGDVAKVHARLFQAKRR